MDEWLSRLRHDLVKRAVWPARDLREAHRDPQAADLLQLRAGLFDLRDGEGAKVHALQLWERMRREAPPLPAAALDSFGDAVAQAERSVAALADRADSWREAVDAVLRIESAFATLARTLERSD
jgi:hypothetical protein